ncbi:MFS transporter [Martelella sp. HB161492]|uniref:MFS transporter n=1 Tax=Martelella sp. HB161492 TaxID=2720726 RepID=UPI001592AA23|nr:MFS transporter [Martelella sp. HB161492]
MGFLLASDNGLRNALIMGMSTLTILAGTTIAPSLPGIVDRFSETPDVAFFAQMILTVPALTIAVTAPFIGMIADRFGRRQLLLASLLVYGLAGAGGLYLDSIKALMISRAVLGIGVGAVMTATTTLVGDYFEGAERIRFMGHRSTAISLGGIVFLVAGGALASLSWRAPFAIYLVALIFLPMAWRLIREPEASTRAPSEDGIGRSIWQEHARHLLLYLAGIVHFLAFYFIFTEIPFRASQLGIRSTATVGIILGTMTLFSALLSMVYPWVRARTSTATMFAIGFAPIALGFAATSFATSVGGLILAMAITGCGAGLLTPNLSATAVARAAPPMRARVAGAMTASIFLGQFLSPAFTFPLAETFGGLATFRILAGLYLLLAALALAGAGLSRRAMLETP